MPRRAPLALLVLLLAGCGGTSTAATIVVPGPSSDPSPLAPAAGANHVHAVAMAVNAGSVLLATHHGVAVAAKGALPHALNAPSLDGDVLQVLYGAGGAAYAAGHNLGIQVSHDGGNSWSVVSPDVAGLDVHGLAADPRDPTQMVAYAVGKGVLVSSDGGLHWTHKAGYADSHYLTGLAITADGTLLAGSPDLGVAASPDRGATFLTVRNGTGRIYSIAASATSADVVTVATENGIFLTTNGGKDWSVGVPMSDNTITGVGIDPLNPSHLLAGDAAGLVFASTDSGQSWAQY